MATIFGDGLSGVLERATFYIDAQKSDEFVAAVKGASELISSSPGFLAMSLLGGIEREGVYLLLVNWNSVADHEAFRSGANYVSWRQAITQFFTAPPEVEHFAEVLTKRP